MREHRAKHVAAAKALVEKVRAAASVEDAAGLVAAYAAEIARPK